MLAPALVLAVYCLGQQPAPLQLPTVALTTEVLPPQLKTVETLTVIATKAGKAR